MIIPLDRSVSTPLYRQIALHFKRVITSGALPAGAKLPATRELASSLQVNRNTINTAYEELLAQGLIVSHVGQGTFVAPQPVSEPDNRPSEAPALSRPAVLQPDWHALFSKGATFAEDAFVPIIPSAVRDQKMISFAAGALSSALFPVDELRRSVDRALREFSDTLLDYGRPDGFAPLKAYLCSYLLDRGVEAREHELLITNGSQQGIDLAARAFLDPGDTVILEAPTYAGAISAFRAMRANIITIPPLACGFDPAHLEDLLRRQRPKMIYLVPTFHNPTGMTADLDTRKRFLETVKGYNVVVLEDDTHDRLRYEGTVTPSLKALSRSRHMMYISTFSSVFPGLRLGWIVADGTVTERLTTLKRITDMHTSDLIQATVYDFCRRRWMERAIERVNTERQRRRNTMLEALDRHMPDGVSWTRPEGGLWLTLFLPEGLDSNTLLDQAAEEGVLYIPGSFFHANSGGQSELRLIFPQLPFPMIDEGIRRLATVINKAMQVQPGVSRRRPSLDPMI